MPTAVEHKTIIDAAESLDRQFSELPKEVKFCKNCVVSNQRPRIRFTEDGLCSACEWSYEKDHVVNWDKREKELVDLCNRFRRNDGQFDVIVPGSGGKDSGFVAHQLKYKYGMHPLCVTWSPFDYTDIGWQNIQSFVKAGFTNILGMPDAKIHRNLARVAFELKGDAWEPFTYGQKGWGWQVAKRFGIKLMMYGEHGELEYGGWEKYKWMPKEDPDVWAYEYFKGASVDELIRRGLAMGVLVEEDLREPTINFYKPIPPDEVKASGMEMHWFSYYKKWVPEENYYYAVQHTGFNPNPEGRSEGTYTKYVSLDDKLDGFHWYLSYMKFGMGRAARDAHQDIRRHHITREEGVALVRRFDGEFPSRHFKWFLDYVNVTEDFFWKVMDLYREKSNVWKKVNGEWKLMHIVS